MNKNNAFGLLRYYAAFCVMYLHFTGYMRTLIPNEFVKITAFRSIVDFYQPTIILFSISGFLISASLERSGLDIKSFVTKRVLRIFPDLWISCLILYTVMTLIFAYVFRLEILSRFFVFIMKKGIVFLHK
ncbi:hypothetical protein SAMN02910382_01524 [Butyrivibrio sp. TB]|nr:hypothetical protein SAMN02910382_01524 [Butyrivibrio sp. TB]